MIKPNNKLVNQPTGQPIGACQPETPQHSASSALDELQKEIEQSHEIAAHMRDRLNGALACDRFPPNNDASPMPTSCTPIVSVILEATQRLRMANEFNSQTINAINL